MDKKHVIKTKFSLNSVRELIDFAAKEYADDYAFSYRKNPRDQQLVRLTFSEFGNEVHALASKFIENGMVGKHCVLIGKLSYEWILTYYAVLSMGAVLVPLDKDWSEEELADTAKKAKADYIFGDEEISDKLKYTVENSDVKNDIIYLNSENESNNLQALVKSGRDIYRNAPNAYLDVPIDTSALALLVFTSGTTGKGKGVMLSQKAIVSDMNNVLHYLNYGKRSIAVLPPHHTYGSTITFIAHVMIGCEVYISSGLRYITKELTEQKPDHLILVPLYLETFYRKILANLKSKGKYETVFRMIKVCKALNKIGIDVRKKVFKEIHDVFGGNIQMIVCGGAPLSREILDFYDGVGFSVLNGYGITECAPLISVNRSKNNILGSVGNPIDEVTVKIDEPNEDGEGEILVKGPNVMLGYYNDEEATKDAFKDGYFRTGDYGKLTKKGILYITGRKKNLIILSNGKNVYPEEIENEFTAIPGVIDVIVYEGQSKRGITENKIVAEIYPDKEFFTKNGITDAEAYFKPFVDDFNRRTTPYKKIGVLKVRDEEFPKNTLKKIQRFKLDMTIE